MPARSRSRSRTPPQRLLPDHSFSRQDLVTRAEAVGWLRYRNRITQIVDRQGSTPEQVRQYRHRRAIVWHIAQRRHYLSLLETRLRIRREEFLRGAFARVSSISSRLAVVSNDLLSNTAVGSQHHRQVLESHQILQLLNHSITQITLDIERTSAFITRNNLQVARSITLQTISTEDLPAQGFCICPLPPCICFSGYHQIFESPVSESSPELGDYESSQDSSFEEDNSELEALLLQADWHEGHGDRAVEDNTPLVPNLSGSDLDKPAYISLKT